MEAEVECCIGAGLEGLESSLQWIGCGCLRAANGADGRKTGAAVVVRGEVEKGHSVCGCERTDQLRLLCTERGYVCRS